MAQHKDFGKIVGCVREGCHAEFKFSKTHYEKYGRFCRTCHEGARPTPRKVKDYILVEMPDGSVQLRTEWVEVGSV